MYSSCAKGKNLRHDKISATLHRDLCTKYGFQYAEKSYNHHVGKESRILGNDDVKIQWDFTTQTERKLEHNKPDLVVLNKKERIAHVVDVGCPFDTRVKDTERTKIEKYTDLK